VLSVVMPAHNEAGYLETAVRDVDEGLRARGHELEILVVENGSTDDTLDIGRRLDDELPSVRVSTRAVADYGAALRDGILAAHGELIVTFDVDYYDLGFVDHALALLTGDAPPAIVVGSKRAPGATTSGHGPGGSSRRCSACSCAPCSRCRSRIRTA
jgi:dolichyl-phosphate beta-glucosyltransferase